MKSNKEIMNLNRGLLRQIQEMENEVSVFLLEISKISQKYKEEWFKDILNQLIIVKMHLIRLKKVEFSLLEINDRVDCDVPEANCSIESYEQHKKMKGMINRVFSSFIILKHKLLDAFEKRNIKLEYTD